jgi:hypothetical protein
MTIQVTCPGCKKRFGVSDKFAGKKGPCPKCKAEITIPASSEEVKVHEPEGFGPKGAGGRAALKPIFREESKFSPVTAGIIGAPLLLALILAIVFRDPDDPSLVVFLLLSFLVAVSLAYAGYIVFRDNDLEPFRGKNLWMRVGVCALLFAGTWGIVALVNTLGMNGEGFSMPVMMILLAVIVAIGGGISYICFDLEYLNGAMHYGMFLVVSILLRLIVLGSALPLVQDGGPRV